MSPKNIDYSFKILEEILMLKKYKNKEEVISVAEAMTKVAEKNEKCSKWKIYDCCRNNRLYSWSLSNITIY